MVSVKHDTDEVPLTDTTNNNAPNAPVPPTSTAGTAIPVVPALTANLAASALSSNAFTALPSPLPPPASPPPSPQRTRLQITVIMTSLSAGVFVAALDVTIIATALPTIAGHFRSESGYTWIGSAYILANTATTPCWGKVSDIWGRKPILLVGLTVFFVGSVICSFAGSMGLFVAGRAVQGVGAGGLITLVNICIGDLFSLRDRGMYFGVISVVWAFASGVGPVLGGIFTERLTWRWCFYINLPITGVVFCLLYFALRLDTPETPIWEGLKAVDWTGSLLIVGSTLMLLLGLDFGGVSHPWNSATVICLLVFGICVGGLFVLNEWKVTKYPIIPLHLFRHWSGIASFSVCFCHGYVFMGDAYYMPLYFQAVLGASPLMSGVYLLPFILALTIMAALTGLYIQKTGKYIQAVYVGLALMTLGIGLLIDLDVEANWGKLIIFQIIAGIGVGLNFEGPLLALQALVATQDVATATSTIGFVRSISTAISVVIGAVVFQNHMVKEAPKLVAGLGPQVAKQLGGNAAANIGVIDALPPGQQIIARQALYQSLRMMWIMYVAFAALGLFAGLFIGVHPLSKEHKPVVLGLVRTDTNQSGVSGPPESTISGNLSSGHEIIEMV